MPNRERRQSEDVEGGHKRIIRTYPGTQLLWRSLLSPVWQCRGAVIRIQLTYYCSPPLASKYQDFLLLSCELNTRDLGWAEQQIIHWLLLPLSPCEQHFLHQWFIFGSAGKEAARGGFSLWLGSCLLKIPPDVLSCEVSIECSWKCCSAGVPLLRNP